MSADNVEEKFKKLVDSIKIDVEELKERSEEERTKAWWYEIGFGALLVLFFTFIVCLLGWLLSDG